MTLKYTKKQKALFRGLCYMAMGWIFAFFVASVGIDLYIRFVDSELVARDTAIKLQPYVLILVGVPSFMIGYDLQMRK